MVKDSQGTKGVRDKKSGAELTQNLVAVNRVSKVVKGGKRFGFSALAVVGDKAGCVGYGSGKAREVSQAVRKAMDKAQKSMVRVPLKEGRTLHHDISHSFGAGSVHIRSAPQGTGVIAGGPMRAVFDALGIQDVVGKSLGSSRPHSMVKATFGALTSSLTPRAVAAKRGKAVSDVFARSSKNRGQSKAEEGKSAAEEAAKS